MTSINHRTRPLDLSGGAQSLKQEPMQLGPHTRPLPLIQTPPTGDPRTEAKLARQVTPGDPGVEHEEDPRQCLTVGMAPPSAGAGSLFLRKQRLD
jgi:hypothetical protein